MGLITKDIETTIYEVIGFECDRCGRIDDDSLEIQEIFHFKTIGGYSSVWGDGAIVEAVLCQHCVKELFEPFAKVSHESY